MTEMAKKAHTPSIKKKTEGIRSIILREMSSIGHISPIKNEEELATTKTKLLADWHEYEANLRNKIVKGVIVHNPYPASKDKDNMISIPYDKVVRFLTDYCKIDPVLVSKHYEYRIKVCGKGEYKEVKLLPTGYLSINDIEYTIEGAIAKNLFRDGSSAKAIADRTIRGQKVYPENVAIALGQLIELSAEKNDNVTRRDFSPLVFVGYKPGCMDSLRNFETIRMSLGACTSKDQVAKKMVHTYLETVLLYHYNSFTYQTCQLYQKLFKSYDERSGISNLLNPEENEAYKDIIKYGECVKSFVRNDIHREQDNSIKFLKYWLYLQIATLSYLKANYFVFTQLMATLDGFEFTNIKNLMLKRQIEILKQNSISKCIFTDGNYYFQNYGMVIPLLSAYTGYLSKVKETRGLANADSNACDKYSISLLQMLSKLSSYEINKSLYLPDDNTLIQEILNSAAANECKKSTIDAQCDIIKSLQYYSIAEEILQSIRDISSMLEIKLSNMDNTKVLANFLTLRGKRSLNLEMYLKLKGKKDSIFLEVVKKKDGIRLFELFLRYNLIVIGEDDLGECQSLEPEMIELINAYTVSSVKRQSFFLSTTPSQRNDLAYEGRKRGDSMISNQRMFFSQPREINPAEQKIPSIDIPLQYSGVLPNGQLVLFTRKPIPDDGNCGFHALSVTRVEVANALLQPPIHVTLEISEQRMREKCEMLAPEIGQALMSGEAGFSPEGWPQLRSKLNGGQEELDNLIRDILAEYSEFKPQSEEEQKERNVRLLNFLKNKRTAQTTELSEKFEKILAEVAHSEEIVSEYCRKKEIFTAYAHALKDSSLWLGYRSARIYAEESGINLYIWSEGTVESQSGVRGLVLQDYFETDKPSRVIHMFHTRRATHFDVLSPEIQPEVRNEAELNTVASSFKL